MDKSQNLEKAHLDRASAISAKDVEHLHILVISTRQSSLAVTLAIAFTINVDESKQLELHIAFLPNGKLGFGLVIIPLNLAKLGTSSKFMGY